jgi:catechol 2,3-dioxygenase-like lactoylglutathione lyase family enzyme
VVSAKALLGGEIFQIGIVVRDLEAALTRYSTVLGAAPWRCYRFSAAMHTSCEYRGGPTAFSAGLALNDQSPQLELVEPREGPSIHADWLTERGEGVHHVGVIVDSVPSAVSTMSRAGYPVIQSGEGFGDEGDGAYAYFDTVGDLGLVVEAVEPPTRMPEPDFLWPRQ